MKELNILYWMLLACTNQIFFILQLHMSLLEVIGDFKSVFMSERKITMNGLNRLHICIRSYWDFQVIYVFLNSTRLYSFVGCYCKFQGGFCMNNS